MRRTLRDDLVTVVGSGREAIELLARNPAFDLIFCDLMMPEKTGMDVHEWLEAHHPALAARMVFMTGGMFTPRAHEFLARVENHRIEKPFELRAIRRYVRETMAARARSPSSAGERG
jgi:CheY-like chemotaxis protein